MIHSEPGLYSLNNGIDWESIEEGETFQTITDSSKALIAWDLKSIAGNKFKNMGSGGEIFDGVLNPKSGEVQLVSGGVKFTENACVTTGYALSNVAAFTVAIKMREIVDNPQNVFGRVFRGSGDCPSIYAATPVNGGCLNVKLSGNKSVDAAYTYTNEAEGLQINAKSTHVLWDTRMSGITMLNQSHVFAFSGNGTDLNYYRDGMLLASQKQILKAEAVNIGVGETGTTNYSLKSFILEKFLVYDMALPLEEIRKIV